MSPAQLGILVVGGLAGWWVVSYLFDRGKRGNASAARADEHANAPEPEPNDREPTLLELGERWHAILGVAPSATIDEIEAAYAARRIELGRRRYSSGADESELRAVALQLRTLDAAYEFVRAARAGGV